jgi:glucose/arabinose dehydrogenase
LVCAALALTQGLPADAASNSPPATPRITEPSVNGQIAHPGDVHMETSPFSDPDAGNTHVCTDWEIRASSASGEVAWQSPCNTEQKIHVHLGDGSFVNSYAGKTELNYDTNYVLLARHKDSSGDPATEWSSWGTRSFRTSSLPPPGTSTPWTLKQSGFEIDVVATGFKLPVNIAFLPNPGTEPSSPYFYVTELYGTIKVVSRDGTVSDYIRGVLNYQPSGKFPGSGEQGMTGIVVEPATGDVFASMLYLAANGQHYAEVRRFHSNHGGSVAGSSQRILNIPENFGSSHQISNVSIGPDGKLYVHTGDGHESDAATAARDPNSYRGKILRLNLDGSAATDNPFYDASNGITARDYVFAYGFRNPFGGDWRAADGQHYEVENGPNVDRFAKVVRGRNYLWDGTDASMRNHALYNWSPSAAPVNLAFIQPETFGGSGFPQSKMGHAFVSQSGKTYISGPSTEGKKITEFALDSSGNRVSGPTQLLDYTGTGKATVVGLTAGPDGLYFTDLYKDSGTAPTDVGANVLRIRWTGNESPSVNITSPSNGASFTPPADITIEAEASDIDGTVSKVEFFQGSNKIGEDSIEPYGMQWNGVPEGNYSLTAKATDNRGATTASSAVNVVVGQPQPTNLLKNGGFEIDGNANGRPDSWTSSAKFTRTNTVVFRGSFAGRHRATDNSGYTIRQTVSSLVAGTTYHFAGQVNIPSTTDTFTFRLQVRWINGSGGTISTKTIKTYTGPTGGWNLVSGALAAPSGTKKADVRMVAGSLKATIYVDGFEFARA